MRAAYPNHLDYDGCLFLDFSFSSFVLFFAKNCRQKTALNARRERRDNMREVSCVCIHLAIAGLRVLSLSSYLLLSLFCCSLFMVSVTVCLRLPPAYSPVCFSRFFCLFLSLSLSPSSIWSLLIFYAYLGASAVCSSPPRALRQMLQHQDARSGVCCSGKQL